MSRKASVAATLFLMADLVAAQPRQPNQTPKRPPADLCDTPEHHQFDFWIGRWDVYRTATDRLIAHSRIEKVYNGCAVRENWMPLSGIGGGSLNSYRPGEKRWRQFWTDAANNVHEYAGQIEGTSMAMTGTGTNHTGAIEQLRMTFTPQADGSVIQKGEKSVDQGKTWQPYYELIYRPAQGGEKG